MFLRVRVSVTAGGQILREGLDFSIDYNLGTVKILNPAILNSGLPINVQFENNAGLVFSSEALWVYA